MEPGETFLAENDLDLGRKNVDRWPVEVCWWCCGCRGFMRTMPSQPVWLLITSAGINFSHSLKNMARSRYSRSSVAFSSSSSSSSTLTPSTDPRDSLIWQRLKQPDVVLSALLTAPFSLSEKKDSPTLAVKNPARPDEILAHLPVMDERDTRQAIERSESVLLDHWRDGTTADSRAQLLTTWSRLMQEHAEDLATIMTLESGKPLGESRGEVTYGRSFVDVMASEATRSTGAGGGSLWPTPFVVPGTTTPRGRLMMVQQAVGVTALITPWNFPLAMITRKAGPALAVGCTAVIKPSEYTPLTALALLSLADQAGIPPGVLQLITANKDTTKAVGQEMCTHPAVRKISFTGSTAVGKILMQQASSTVKRLSLELGGNAPFCVFDDADLSLAVEAAMSSKFRHAGQTCVCADRFLVQASVHDEFVQRLQERMDSKLRVGDGMDPDTTMGPLIYRSAVDAVHTKVQEALAEGAHCVTGGQPLPELGPHFYAPTLLTNVDKNSRIWAQETFGPVVAVRSFETEAEALALANELPVGLAAYFCTRDLGRVFRFSSGLECGMVGINEGIISTATAPFGGVKESGLGREGSALGLAEYLETKYILINA